MIYFVRKFLCWLAPVLLLSLVTPATHAGQELFVVYPETNEPFRTVFEQIVQGIESRAAVRRYVLRNNVETSEIEAWLAEEKPAAIVALGQRGARMTYALNTRLPLVVGAVLVRPKETRSGVIGISLAPDPGLLFARLRTLAPRVRRVVLVYSEAQSGWLIAPAHEAARQNGLELVAHPVADLRAAAQVYREALGKLGKQDALWLPLDAVALDEVTLLPTILESAWSRKVVVFSSSVGHVAKGALFALYPDNAKLGRRLAEMALDAVRGETGTFTPSLDVLLAVNVRTASHLGSGVVVERRGADLVFPSP